MNIFKKLSMRIGISVIATASLISVASPVLASASTTLSATTDPSVCSQGFLTFPTWFHGVVHIKANSSGNYECVIDSPKSGDLGPFIWHIVLNVVEIGLQIVAYLTAGFIIWGGFLFLTSQGSPDAATKARKTIFDAVIGFGISVISIAAINLLSGILIYNP